jgi:diaminohydroxyphosphoribosylaminopyrimidine deaminase/5-amino-6-(5-phosphoribosylamino)uracil reductase
VSNLGITTLDDHLDLELISVQRCGSDIKSHYAVKER